MTQARFFWRGLLAFSLLSFLLLSSASPTMAQKNADQAKGGAETVQIDLSKLPASLAAKVREYLDEAPKARKGQGKAFDGFKGKGKKAGKKKQEEERSISLLEAVVLAQRSGQGEAIKAERHGKDGHWSVELRSKEGQVSTVHLDAHGAVVADRAKGKGAPFGPKKGKGKFKA
jgi:hypothetical protein